MPPSDVLRDLELLFQSRYGLIHIVSDEPDRALSLLQHLADRISTPLFTWSRIEGIQRVGWDQSIFQTKEPRKAMAHVAAADIPAIYHFHGMGSHLETDEVFRAQVKAGAKKVIISAPTKDAPDVTCVLGVNEGDLTADRRPVERHAGVVALSGIRFVKGFEVASQAIDNRDPRQAFTV